LFSNKPAPSSGATRDVEHVAVGGVLAGELIALEMLPLYLQRAEPRDPPFEPSAGDLSCEKLKLIVCTE
jgi:hypothetical protein